MEYTLRKAFSGKSAIITGGSRGIGRATAMELARIGCTVFIMARDKNALQEAADNIRKTAVSTSITVRSISADCTDYKKMKSEISKLIKEHGTPHYLFNFVGYAYPQYLQKLTFDDFRKNMDTNYYGQLAPILATLPFFIEAGGGHILNCSSVSGFLGLMGYATYTPTKFAIAGLTESLRNELKPYGIDFSLLYPPDTKTPGFDKENETKPEELMILSEGGGLLKPEDVAIKALKGVAKKKFYILPGQSRLLWTLVRHFPNLSHRILDSELKKASKKMQKR